MGEHLKNQSWKRSREFGGLRLVIWSSRGKRGRACSRKASRAVRESFALCDMGAHNIGAREIWVRCQSLAGLERHARLVEG